MVRDQLRSRGIHDARVLEAMGRVPRHAFAGETSPTRAYGDFPLDIGDGQTISQPYMVALMTEALALDGSQRVLEIGTGSGYQTALLAELARNVYTVERIGRLSERAKGLLDEHGYANVHYRVGDGTLGWPDFAPYDRIIVTAGAPLVPAALTEQLEPDGSMVIPVGGRADQELLLVERTPGGTRQTCLTHCIFVKLLGQQGW
jgi:protein-L-isoaspartate(D-aspartate) O-methyltransferase